MALVYTVRAETLLLSGRVAEARETLERGVAALPDNLPALVALCEALLEAGQAERVVALMSPLVEREDVPPPVQPAILCTLATALVRADKERLSDADAYSEHALGLAPNDPECALARGYVLTELGQYHEATKLFEDLEAGIFERSIRDTRDSYLALLEFRRGRAEAARSMLRRLSERGARGAALDEVRAVLR
jgi:tetratricopeptide (TPR) repeat protein